MKSFRAFLLWVALAGAAIAQPASLAAGSFSHPPLAREPHPSMASFADVYRMTVGVQETLAFDEAARARTGEAAVRVSSGSAAAEAEFRVRVTPAREPHFWLLILSGLALAGWVAHKRLVHGF
jgi:hypothetical protein